MKVCLLSVKSISAAHTVVIAADWTTRPGERTPFTIIAHDSTGHFRGPVATTTTTRRWFVHLVKKKKEKRSIKNRAVVEVN